MQLFLWDAPGSVSSPHGSEVCVRSLQAHVSSFIPKERDLLFLQPLSKSPGLLSGWVNMLNLRLITITKEFNVQMALIDQNQSHPIPT